MRSFKFKVFSALVALSLVLVLGTCNLFKDEEVQKRAKEGIYVGIADFSGNTDGVTRALVYDVDWNSLPTFKSEEKMVQDLVRSYQSPEGKRIGSESNPSLAFLDKDTVGPLKTGVLAKYTSRQDNEKPKPVVFAVNQAWNAINGKDNDRARLPKSLDNVTIVTFTSGYDFGSATVFNEVEGESYTIQQLATHVKNKLNQKIQGANIKSYAVALPVESDLQSTQDWTLEHISTPGHIRKVADTDALKDEFKNIVKGIEEIKYAATLVLRIFMPGEYVNSTGQDPDGHDFFASFDGETSPETSTKYIKGKMARAEAGDSSSPWQIQNAKYVNGDEETDIDAIIGTSSGNDCNFIIDGLQGIGTTNGVTVRRWFGNSWAPVPFATGENTEVKMVGETKQKSAVVFLVLDATLSNIEVGQVREAAADFIQALYEETVK